MNAPKFKVGDLVVFAFPDHDDPPSNRKSTYVGIIRNVRRKVGRQTTYLVAWSSPYGLNVSQLCAEDYDSEHHLALA